MGMKCKCGGEIDLSTGKCRGCGTQNISMTGNASIKMKEKDGSTTELKSEKKNTNVNFLIKIELDE